MIGAKEVKWVNEVGINIRSHRENDRIKGVMFDLPLL